MLTKLLRKCKKSDGKVGVGLDVNQELKLLCKCKKGLGLGSSRGMGGCEPRIEVIVKMQKQSPGVFWKGVSGVDVNQELKLL